MSAETPPPPDDADPAHPNPAPPDTASSEPATRRQQVAATGLATTVGALGTTPIFAIGAAAAFMSDTIDFGPADLGLSVFVFYVVAALAGPQLGAVAGRLGSRRGMVIAVVATVAATAGLAAAPSKLVVLTCMAVAGFANALAQLSANVHLSAAVSPGRQGIGFGVRRSATPLASALAGAAVPVVALTAGWRAMFWVFVALGAVALLAVLRSGRSAERKSVGEAALPRSAVGRLRLLAVANLLGNASTTALATFLVLFLVSAHTNAATAGTMALIGGLLTVLARVSLGLAADRFDLPTLPIIGMMMLLGGAAIAAMTIPGPTGLVLVAVCLAYLVGWGWTGLIDLHVVRGHRASPGRATGITYAGQALGAGAGPLLTGWIVDQFGFAPAWWVVAAMMVMAGTLVLSTSKLRRHT